MFTHHTGLVGIDQFFFDCLVIETHVSGDVYLYPILTDDFLELANSRKSSVRIG